MKCLKNNCNLKISGTNLDRKTVRNGNKFFYATGLAMSNMTEPKEKF